MRKGRIQIALRFVLKQREVETFISEQMYSWRGFVWSVCVCLSCRGDLCSCADSSVRKVFRNKTAFCYSETLSAVLYDIIRARSGKVVPKIQRNISHFTSYFFIHNK